MKNLIIVSSLFFAVSCSEQNTETVKNLTTNQQANIVVSDELITELNGKELMTVNCLICHGNGTSHDDILAPPMKGVKNHYFEEGMSENEFISSIVNWVNDPKDENSKMQGAIHRFKIMPKLSYDYDELKAIAKYIYNNDMPKPIWFDKHLLEEHSE